MKPKKPFLRRTFSSSGIVLNKGQAETAQRKERLITFELLSTYVFPLHLCGISFFMITDYTAKSNTSLH
jgi:hypothetical protein